MSQGDSRLIFEKRCFHQWNSHLVMTVHDLGGKTALRFRNWSFCDRPELQSNDEVWDLFLRAIVNGAILRR